VVHKVLSKVLNLSNICRDVILLLFSFPSLLTKYDGEAGNGIVLELHLVKYSGWFWLNFVT
jgi:hypothetical protein